MKDEQKQAVKDITTWHYSAEYVGGEISKTVAHAQRGQLLEIIDDLQKEVEQLTKERNEYAARLIQANHELTEMGLGEC